MEAIKRGDILCFGKPNAADGFDGRWLVLDPEHTNTGDPGMFLLSLSLVGRDDGETLLFRNIGDVSVSFLNRGGAYTKEHPGVTAYQGSDIQKWCATFPENHFSKAEQAALIPTHKSDSAIVIPGFGIPLPGATKGTVDFDPAEQVLRGDQIFLPSVEEIVNEAYGLTDNGSRVAQFKGEPKGYWLRSPHIDTFPLDVGFVFPFGMVMDYPVNGKSMYQMATYARPCCNLDATKICGYEKLAEERDIKIWRICFEEDVEEVQEYELTLPEVEEVMDLSGKLKSGIKLLGGILLAIVTVGIGALILKRKK